MKKIQFRDDLAFCSNFYKCPVTVFGMTFPSSEHAFMSAKTTDPKIKQQIAKAETPAIAKAMGRQIELRPDWDIIKSSVMLTVLLAKFSQNPDLLEKLKNVPDEDLVETNTWGDTYWGVCNGHGKNILGKLLQLVKVALSE